MNPETGLDKQDKAEITNFTRTPNMLIFGYRDTLSPQEKWLYVCLKHLCGKRGTRHLSLRYIAEQTGISVGALSKSKHSEGMIKHLHDAGLIHAEIKRPGGRGNAQYHITITDVWALNQAFFRSEFGQDEEGDAEPVRISDEPVQNSDKPAQVSDKVVQNSDEPVREIEQYQDYIQDDSKTITKTKEQENDSHSHSGYTNQPIFLANHPRRITGEHPAITQEMLEETVKTPAVKPSKQKPSTQSQVSG